VALPDGSSIPSPIGDSTGWQHWVIDVVRRHERDMGHQRHPVGMTAQFPVPDQARVTTRYGGGAGPLVPDPGQRPGPARDCC
jgi:hypothetical protein